MDTLSNAFSILPLTVFNLASEKKAVMFPVAVMVVAATVPPDWFVAVVALVANPALVADEAKVALVADEAKVAFVAKPALVAEEAAPLKVAVIVPALKLPEASRATTLLAVLVVVASTANVRAVDPLKVPPLVRYVPAVKAAAVAFAVVAVVASVAVVANVARVASVAVVASVALVAEVDEVAKVALVAEDAKVALVADPAAMLDWLSQVGAAAALLWRTCPEMPTVEYACAVPVP